jgi:hypothetical protein
MLNTGNKLNLTWLSPTLVLFAFVVGTVLKYSLSLSLERYAVLLLNLVGIVLLASAFEPQIPLHGDGGLWDSLKWAARQFPKYGSPPAFDFLRFYIGLFLLLVGIVVSVVLS